MKLSVFGIGYVGCVSAACFANSGHDVTGVDLNATKVEIINSGKSPIVEAGIDEADRRDGHSGTITRQPRIPLKQ
jgi:GDP-mannose 6-dehydrogenase